MARRRAGDSRDKRIGVPGPRLVRLGIRFPSLFSCDFVFFVVESLLTSVPDSVVAACHIRSTTSIPSRPAPNFKVRPVRSHSASRLSRRSGDSALSTGHSS